MKKTVCFECGAQKLIDGEGAYWDGKWFHCWNCMEEYKNGAGKKESTRWKKNGLDIAPNVDELLLDVLWQACGEDEDGLIDNRCLSSYEQACTYLCKRGLLVSDSKKSGRIYFLARKKDLKSTIDGGKI
jgi:hypothetical protein